MDAPYELADLPEDWRRVLADEIGQSWFSDLLAFVCREREQHLVFPPDGEVFSALRHTPYEKVRVLILGQDPYHDNGQAHGLCFSVRDGVRPPPSLINIFKELKSDLGIETP